MPPDHARVAHFEDDESMRNSTKSSLKTYGHRVVVEAGTYEDAVKAIPQLRKRGVECVILDNDFQGKQQGLDLLERIRELYGNEIKVVASSSYEFPVDPRRPELLPDVDFFKVRFGPDGKRLGQVITDL